MGSKGFIITMALNTLNYRVGIAQLDEVMSHGHSHMVITPIGVIIGKNAGRGRWKDGVERLQVPALYDQIKLLPEGISNALQGRAVLQKFFFSISLRKTHIS